MLYVCVGYMMDVVWSCRCWCVDVMLRSSA